MALRGVATQANSTIATTCVVTVSGIGGTGPLSGDILIATFGWGGGGSSTVTSPGWSAISGVSNGNVNSSWGTLTGGVLWKVAGSSEPATYTFTSATNDFATVHIRCYSGRLGSPFAVSPVTTGPVASVIQPVSLSITGFTGNTGDDLVLLIPNQGLAAGTDVLSFTPPSGWGNSSINYSAGGQGSSAIAACDFIAYGGGATGTLTGTITDTELHNTGYVGFLISLAPYITLIQSKAVSNFVTAVNSLSATFSNPVKAGNTLIAYVGVTDVTAGGTYTVADTVNAGNYTLDVSNGGVGNFYEGIYRFSASAAGTPTVTVTKSSGTAHLAIVLQEWSGLAPSSPLDQSISNFNSVINHTPTSGNTGNYLQPGELMLSCGVGASSLTWGAGTGFTMDPQTPGGLGGKFAVEYQILPSTTATAASYTLGGGDEVWQVLAATYRPATPNLGAQTASFSQGQASMGLSKAASAQTITSSAGTIAKGLSLTLTGQTATFGEGSILNQITLSGQTATFAEGVITKTVTGNPVIALSGLAATFSQGPMSLSISYLLDQNTITMVGQTAAFAQGTISATVTAALAAQTITSTEGVPTRALSAALTGQTRSFIEGVITASTPSSVIGTLSAQVISAGQGVLSPVLSYAVTAQSITGSLGTVTFSKSGDIVINLNGLLSNFTEGVLVLAFPGGMPNVVGYILREAELVLQQAGVLQPKKLNYFSTYPITYHWVPSTLPPSVVLAQSIPPGTSFTVNQPITLTLSQFPFSVSPGG